ncbi:MAG: hypothetical protein O3C28_19945 [Proteobacteria bacterium]|nr:hypothetical protein [Pseudomonadota bacterium]
MQIFTLKVPVGSGVSFSLDAERAVNGSVSLNDASLRLECPLKPFQSGVAMLPIIPVLQKSRIRERAKQ